MKWDQKDRIIARTLVANLPTLLITDTDTGKAPRLASSAIACDFRSMNGISISRRISVCSYPYRLIV